MQERRLAQVESQLSAREKLFVWLEQVREIGFLEYGLRSLRGERRPELQLNGEETARLYHMVVECNTDAQMILRDANLVRVIALFIRQLVAGRVEFDGEMEAECLRSELIWLAVQVQALRQAVKQISESHFEGRPVLFYDSEAVLDRAQENLKELLTGYGFVCEKAGLRPIFDVDLQAEIETESARLAELFEAMAKTRVLMQAGCRLTAAKTLAETSTLKSFKP
jgi:hypothetical protein